MIHFPSNSSLRLVVLAAVGMLSVARAVAREITPAEAVCRLSAAPLATEVSLVPQRLHLVRTMTHNSHPVLYAFDRTDGPGYVVTSADDAAPVVLGYSEAGSFEDAMTVPAFRQWMNETHMAMALCPNFHVAMKQTRLHRTIKPLINTTWGQGDTKLDAAPHYNTCTPQDNGQQCLVGCTATAMAQIMKRYDYPTRGQGSHSYELDRIGTVSADFDVEYRWDLMQDHYGFTVIDGDTINYEFTPEANDAVSTLMYHCGVGCDMQYGVTGSSAWELEGGYALVEYFDYDRGIHGEQRTFYSDYDWDEMIYAELAEGRPFIYVAYTEKGYGHAFVADGYLNGLYHINWGWNGLANGYYTILTSEALHPKTVQKGGTYVYDAFTSRHSVVLGIQPPDYHSSLHPSLGLEGNYSVTDGDLHDTSRGRNEEVHYVRSSAFLYNYSCYPLAITSYGVRLYDRANRRQYEFEDEWGSAATLRIYDGANPDFKFVPRNVPDGTYEVRIVYRLEGEDGWFEAQTLPSVTIPTLTFSDGIEFQPDGIRAATSDEHTAGSYDLSGRRAGTTGHGIVIRGNEKMIK